MSESYYKPCRELEICDELIETYFNTQQYEKGFEGHLALAEQGYPLTSPVLYREAEKVLRSLVRFEPATEDDAQTIIELRKQIWGTTYRGFYPDSMIDDFDYGWHLEKELQRIRSSEYCVYRIVKDAKISDISA